MGKLSPLALAAALSVTLLSCAERQSPFEPLSARPPVLTVVPPSVSGFEIPLTDPYSPAWQLTPLPTYNDPAIVLVSVYGRIFVNPLHPSKSASLVDGTGYWREDSIQGCYVNVQVNYGATVWPSGCGAPQQQVRSDTILVQGSGTVKRGGVVGQWPWECDYSQCWSYSLYDGVQTLSLQPLSPTIDILTPGTAQSPHGVIALPAPGTGTTVQVSSTPSTIKGIQVPIRVLSWSWLPRPGGDGGTSVGCTGTKVLCSMTFTETGSLMVSAIVNGTEQMDTLIVTAPEIRIEAQRTTMQPSVVYTKRNGVPVNRPSSQTVTVSVSNDAGPIPNQTVSLRVFTYDDSAGHKNHTANTKPKGSFTNGSFVMQFNTGPTGTGTVTYTAPDPSGPVRIEGTMSGARKGVAKIRVMVGGLMRLPFNDPAYDTIGATSIHPDNHWVTPNHLGYLVALANMFRTEYPTKKLTFNDSSLELGGLFDNVDNTGFWTYPHRTHRFGRETDLKTNNLTSDELDTVRDIWVHDLRSDVGLRATIGI